MDSITVLTHLTLPATKIITEDDVIGYSRAKTFNIATFELASFADMAILLTELQGYSNSFVIRGVPVTNSSVVQRKNEFFESHPVGSRWIMLDFDKKVRPDWLPIDLDLMREYLITQCAPNVFHDSSCYWHWSSTAGIDGWKTLSGHAWFWLKQPLTDYALQQWAKSVRLDPAPYRTVQPNYTANPLFVGVQDPIPSGQRATLVERDRDYVDLQFVPPPPPVFTKQVQSNDYVPRGKFDKLLNNIGQDHLNTPVWAAIISWIVTTGPSSDFDTMKGYIRGALSQSPRSGEIGTLTDSYFRDQINAAYKKGYTHLATGPSIPLCM